MPCRLVAPVLEEIAEEQTGRLIVAKLNVDDNPATAETYQLQSVPGMGVFSYGELVKSILGARPKPTVMDQLAEFFRRRLTWILPGWPRPASSSLGSARRYRTPATPVARGSGSAWRSSMHC